MAEHQLQNLQNAKIFVDWTEAQNREKIVPKENISLSLGKIAKLFTDIEENEVAFTKEAKSAYEIKPTKSQYTVSSNLCRNTLLLQKNEASLVPINSVDNDIGISKELTTEEFNPFGKVFYYNSTSNIVANQNVNSANLYEQIVFDIRYSFNCDSLLPNTDIYIVASPLSNGFAKLNSSPLSQSLPTVDNGLIYIYLGHVCTEYSVELSITHPIYWYKNNKLLLYTGISDTTYDIVSDTSEGLVPRLSGDVSTFLRGDGSWSSPDSITNNELDNILI